MAKNLTRYIVIALVLGIIAGWAINAAIDDGTTGSALTPCGDAHRKLRR